MKITWNTELTAADLAERTITGRIVPFGEVGTPNVGKVVFAPGSLRFSEPSQVRLNLEHDRVRVIGKATSIEERTDGLWATFKIANTVAGNDALVEAVEGLRTGLSIEAMMRESVKKGDVHHVSLADLTGTALVTNPAFSSAGVTEIAASEDEENSTETVSAEAEKESEEVVNDVQTPVAEAETPLEASANLNGFAYVKPRSAIVDGRSYMEHSIKAALGNTESATWVRAADDSTATNTGLTLPGHMNDFVTSTFGSRPAIDAIGVSPLVDTGMSFTIPRMGTAPTVATTAEGGAPSETGMTSDYITVSVVKKSGINRVSVELLERSLPNFGDLLLSEMRKAYAKDTDAYVISALTAGGTAATATAGTVAGLQSFIATEGPAAWTATGGDIATELIANTSWWSALVSAVDGSSRPLYPHLSPSNANGTVGVRSSEGDVLGTNFRVDQNMVSGLIDESAFLVVPDAVAIWESPTVTLRANVLTSGEVEIAMYGYIACSVLKAGGIRRFNLT